MPNFSRQLAPRRIDVDADDHVGADHARALDHVEADAAEAEHHDLGARLDLRGVDHRADAGGDAAADVADLVEGRVLADLRQRDLRHHGVVGEGRGAHVVVQLLARRARSGCCRRASGPGPGSRGSPGTGWSCGFRQYSHSRHSGVYSGMTWSPFFSDFTPGADVDHDARALVAEDRGEQAFRIGARERELIGVADAGGLDLDQHLAGPRAFEVDASRW